MRGICVLLVIASCAFHISLGQAAQFTPLGDLAGGGFYSSALGVSDNGKVVVGGSAVGGVHDFVTQAYRWEAGIMVPLGTLPDGSTGSAAFATSANGQVVVGSIRDANNNPSAFRWEAGSTTFLNPLPGHIRSEAYGLTPDGTTVVGYGAVPGDVQALRWQGGVPIGLGHLPGPNYTTAQAVSADGSVVVGYSDPANPDAFRWEAGTISTLSGVPSTSGARGISADATVIVGAANPSVGFVAIRWEDGVTTYLGDLPGGAVNAEALAVTADGSVVVGHGSSDSGQEAFIWDEQQGLRSLRDVLTNEYGLGAALAGWHLTEARDISADGRTIVGNGLNPDGYFEGWIFTVPEPPSFFLASASLICLAVWQLRYAMPPRRRPS
jgi:probable HAF family extracellular repeat protein